MILTDMPGWLGHGWKGGDHGLVLAPLHEMLAGAGNAEAESYMRLPWYIYHFNATDAGQ